MDSAVTAARAKRAAAIKYGNTEAAELAAEDLRAAKAAEYVRRLVESAPPLSDAQRLRLARLLLGGGEAA